MGGSVLGLGVLSASADPVTPAPSQVNPTPEPGEGGQGEPGEPGDEPGETPEEAPEEAPEEVPAGDDEGQASTPDAPDFGDEVDEPDDEGDYYRPLPGEVVGDRDPLDGAGDPDEGLPDTFAGLPAVSTAADYRLEIETSVARVRLPGGDIDATVHLTSDGPSNWNIKSFKVQAAAPAVDMLMPVAPVTGTDCRMGNDYRGHTGVVCTIHLHVTPTIPDDVDVALDGVVVAIEIRQDNGDLISLAAARPLRVERPIPIYEVTVANDVARLAETGGLVQSTVTVRNAGEDTATLEHLSESVVGASGADPGPVDLWLVPGSTCGPIVLTPGASWSCSYLRWYVGEANVALQRTIEARGKIDFGTVRSYRGLSTETFDDVVPTATFDVDATAALRSRDGGAAQLAIQLVPRNGEGVMVDTVTVQLNGVTVDGSAAGCALPRVVDANGSLACDVSVPLQPGVPGTVVIDASYHDNEGNVGTLSDILVVQMALAGAAPMQPSPAQAGGTGGSSATTVPPSPAPAARPVSTVSLPITGRAIARMGLGGMGLAGLGLLCSAAAVALRKQEPEAALVSSPRGS